MKNILSMLLLLMSVSLVAQDNPLESYRLYTKKGKEVKFDKMIKKMSKADVVLIGEIHNNPISHWLQLKITQAIFERKSKLTLGAEMFETDDQLLMDEYLSGIIRQKDFEKYANLWGNYSTDYKPLMEFAVENGLKFIATNIPRRYASIISREGFEGLEQLSDEAKAMIAPLPIAFDTTVTSYVEMMNMEMGHGMGRDNPDIIKAQASKDATMAWFITQNRVKKTPFIHFQGDFHSANYSGINWYLNQYQHNLNIINFSTILVEDLEFKEEYKNQADFILVVKEDMTSTY